MQCSAQRCAKALDDQRCSCATRRELRCRASGLVECAALGAMHLSVTFADAEADEAAMRQAARLQARARLGVRRHCDQRLLGDHEAVSFGSPELHHWQTAIPPRPRRKYRLPQFALRDAHGYDVVTVEPMPENRRVLAASLCLHPQLLHRITVVPVALVSPRANASACVLISGGANLGNGELRCGATLPIDCKSPTNRHRRFLGYHRAAERGGAHGACEVVPTRSLDNVLAQLKSVPDVIDVVKIECATPARTEDLLRSCLPWCHSVQTRARAQPGGKRMQRVGRWAERACLRDYHFDHVSSTWRRKSLR